MDEYVIGIDIGTGSTKGVLATADGEVVHISTRKHDTSFPRPGFAEHDADTVWWQDVGEILRELTSRAVGNVAGVAISGIGPDFLPTTEGGRPLRPGILYGVDTRSSKEIVELTEKYGADKVLEVCGNNMTTQAVGPKMLWVRRNEPEIWAKTKKWFMAHSYCVYNLTGAYVLDHLSASMCEPVYSPFTTDWVDDWRRDICGDLEFPELAWSNEVVGHVSESAARVTGLAPGTPVAMGSTDAFVEAFSVGVKFPGEVMLMYGSTMVAVEISGKPMVGPDLWSCSGLLKGTFNLSGGMSTTGSLTTWLAGVVGSDYATLSREAGQSPPGAHGLVLLPYFSGERSPIADPDARGVLAGLNLTHSRGDIYRAVLESTGYGSRHLLQTVAESGGQASRYVAVGGGTEGGLWPQIMSDVIGISQEIPKVTIGASYGDALLAAMAVGLVDVETTWNEVDRIVEPNQEAHEKYSALYEVYRELYPATQAQMHALAAFQNAAE